MVLDRQDGDESMNYDCLYCRAVFGKIDSRPAYERSSPHDRCPKCGARFYPVRDENFEVTHFRTGITTSELRAINEEGNADRA